MALRDWIQLRHHKPEPPEARAAVWREGYVDVHAKEVPSGEVKGAVMGINDAFASLLSLAGQSTLHSVAAQFDAYRQTSAVATPIDLVAEQFAKVVPILHNQETDDTESSHELLDLLRRPHPLFNRSRFLEVMAKHYLIAAEAGVVALGRLNRPPVQLQPVSPRKMTLTSDRSTGLPREWVIDAAALGGTYRTTTREMGGQFFNGNDRALKMIVGFSPDDCSLLRGQSKLVAAARDVWQQIEGSKYNLQLLKQGGRASLVFHFKSPMRMPEFNEARDAILEQVEGADNAGRVLVTKGGEVDITDMSASNKDMEHQEGQAMMRRALFQRFKIPLVLESTDASTFNNYETALLALWDDAVIPLVGTILSELGGWLMPRFGLDPLVWRVWFDEEKIEVLRSRKIRERSERAKSGLETINEIRREIPGAVPMEGGDELLVSGLLQPLSALAQTVGDLELPDIPPSPPGPPSGA